MHTTGNSHSDMSPEEFRRSAHRLADWIADHLGNLDNIPVLPDVQPGDIRANLPDDPPEHGESMERILDDVDRVIMPGMTHWNHPNFMAYFSITGSGPGILGELLSAAFNVNGMLWKTCPSATELERHSLNWLRQMLGLPDEFQGIIYDTASVSSLHAIAAAREETGFNIREEGMIGRDDLPPLRLYTSEQAHSSIEKAAITLGLGLNNVRKIRTDSEFRMDVNALSDAIDEDRAMGWHPFCVVGTVGTTSTTSIDPIPEIAEICEWEGLWLHVDAAYAGAAALLPEMESILAGCDRADSFVMNPHKWLFVPIDCSAFYTRKPDVLKHAFSLVPEYLRTTEDGIAENLMDYGVQLGRRFRALKLWFVLRYFGKQGLAMRIRTHIELAQTLVSWIEDDGEFELMAPAQFSTVCFRFHPEWTDDQEHLNRLNRNLLTAVNDSRQIYISHTELREHFVLRIALGNLHTQWKHVENAWALIREKARDLQRDY